MSNSLRLPYKWRYEADKILKEKGITKPDLAKDLELSKSTISDFLSGRNAIKYSNAAKICKSLGWNCNDENWENKCIDGSIKNSMLLSSNTSRFSSYLKTKLKRFVGREHIYNKFKEYQENFEKGYYLILADPGEGKSSIAAKYIEENECVYYFNIRSKGSAYTTANQFLKSICNQLIEYGGIEHDHDSIPSYASNDNAYLINLLNKISEKLKSTQNLVIVVDALDEVDLNSQEKGSRILYLPEQDEIPKNIYFLLTSRRDNDVLNKRLPRGIGSQNNILDLRREEIKKESKKDVEQYIDKILQDKDIGNKLQNWYDKNIIGNNRDDKLIKFKQKINDASNCNFMYLVLVLPEIADGAYKNIKPNALPIRLEGYYRDHLSRMLDLIEKRGYSLKVTEIIYYIYTYKDIAIPVKTLIEKTNIDIDIVLFILMKWRQFFNEDERENQKYAFYHESYTDFLRKSKTLKDMGIDLIEFKRKAISRIVGDIPL